MRDVWEVTRADPVPAGCPVDAVSFAQTRSVDQAGSFLFQTLVFFCGPFRLSKSRMPLPRKKCSPQKVEAKKRAMDCLHEWSPKSAFEHLARPASSGGQRTHGPWSQPSRNHPRGPPRVPLGASIFIMSHKPQCYSAAVEVTETKTDTTCQEYLGQSPIERTRAKKRPEAETLFSSYKAGHKGIPHMPDCLSLFGLLLWRGQV